MVVVVYIIQFTVGILANIIVIFVLALSPQKTSTSYHIMHLAVADSLLLLTLPFNADSRLYNGLWRFGSFGCKANESIKMVNFFQSILLIGKCAPSWPILDSR